MSEPPTQAEMQAAVIERLHTERDALAKILRRVVELDTLPAHMRTAITGLLDDMDAPSTFREHIAPLGEKA